MTRTWLLLVLVCCACQPPERGGEPEVTPGGGGDAGLVITAPASGIDAGPVTRDAGPVTTDAGLPDGGSGPDFSELSAYLDMVEQRRVINGYAMQVFDAEERLVFQRSFGQCATRGFCPPGAPSFTPTLVTGVASSSKWVTSTVALAAIEEQVAAGRVSSLQAALDAPLVSRLRCGTVGPYEQLTLRQLLSFTSGLESEHACISARSGETLTSCACEILRDSAATLVMSPTAGTVKGNGHLPGTTFKYGATHHVVVGALLEAWTGESFPALFERLVRSKLGVTMSYRSPLNLAGSMESSVADMAVFVKAIAHDGRGLSPRRLLSKEAVETQRALQVQPSVVLRTSPQEGGQYGLNTWRWCYRPFTSIARANARNPSG